jgi:hypothetical protein
LSAKLDVALGNCLVKLIWMTPPPGAPSTVLIRIGELVAEGLA